MALAARCSRHPGTTHPTASASTRASYLSCVCHSINSVCAQVHSLSVSCLLVFLTPSSFRSKADWTLALEGGYWAGLGPFTSPKAGG